MFREVPLQQKLIGWPLLYYYNYGHMPLWTSCTRKNAGLGANSNHI
jgi:hypothetical protein